MDERFAEVETSLKGKGFEKIRYVIQFFCPENNPCKIDKRKREKPCEKSGQFECVFFIPNSVDDESKPVHDSPNDKGNGRTVPNPPDQKSDKEVGIRAEFSFSVSA